MSLFSKIFGTSTEKEKIDQFIKKETELLEEAAKAKLLKQQLNDTRCRKVEIKWKITNSRSRKNNVPITDTFYHNLKGYVLGTVKKVDDFLPIYDEKENQVRVLIKNDITEIKDIDPSSEIPIKLLSEKIQEWNDTAASDLKIQSKYVLYQNTVYKIIKNEETGKLERQRVDQRSTEIQSLDPETILTYGEYKKLDPKTFLTHGGSSIKTQKQTSNKRKLKSTKKQPKKSKYYKRRTIKKH